MATNPRNNIKRKSKINSRKMIFNIFKEEKKKKECWLFTDWGFALSDFKIYDSYDSFNLITKRTIDKGGCINWFNIDNVKREIEEYAQKNNIKIKGLNETIQSIKSKGFSYTDKDKEKTIQEANEKNKKRDVFNKFSKEIKVVE